MSSGSNIEWTDASWQVTSGCTKVSPGCKNCYAETMANRLAGMALKDLDAGRYPKGKASYLTVISNGAWNRKVVTLPENLTIPLRWKKPRMIFVNSMSDLFHADVPFEFVDQVFAVMAVAHHHTYQVLTKRPERMAEYFARGYLPIERAARPVFTLHGREPAPRRTDPIGKLMHGEGLEHVWIGTSVENQETANERVPQLLRCPATIRFLSVEPLLDDVDLRMEKTEDWTAADYKRDKIDPLDVKPYRRIPFGIDWVIVGGESGHDARPCDVGWIRSVVRQCAEAGVPCFVKQVGARPCGFDQWSHPDNEGRGIDIGGDTGRKLADSKGGDPAEWPADLRVRQMPARQAVPS